MESERLNAREEKIRNLLIAKHAFAMYDVFDEEYHRALADGIYGVLANIAGISISETVYEHITAFLDDTVFVYNADSDTEKVLREIAGDDAELLIDNIISAQDKYSSAFMRVVSILSRIKAPPEEAVNYEHHAIRTIFPTMRSFVEHLNNLTELIDTHNSAAPVVANALVDRIGEQAMANVIEDAAKTQELFVRGVEKYFIGLANELYAPEVIGTD